MLEASCIAVHAGRTARLRSDADHVRLIPAALAPDEPALAHGRFPKDPLLTRLTLAWP